jgi:hypothetical protein
MVFWKQFRRVAFSFLWLVSVVALAISLAAPQKPLQTKFDKDFVPGSQDVGISLPLSNGRQIVRNHAGAWFIGFDTEQGPCLVAGYHARAESRNLSSPVILSQLLERPGEKSSGISMAIDARDHLHVLWSESSGICYVSCDVSGAEGYRNVSLRQSWQADPVLEPLFRRSHLGDVAAGPDGKLWITFVRDGEIWVAHRGDSWKANQVAAPTGRWAVVTSPPDHRQYDIREIEEGCKDPVLAIGPDGAVHVAFAHRWEIYYTRSADGEHWSGATNHQARPRPDVAGWKGPFPHADKAAFAHCFHPSMVLFQGKPLIVFQFEGLVDIDPFSPRYSKERWEGVASIGYAYYDGHKWRRDFVSKSKEIMVKRLPPGAGKEKAPDLDGAGRAILACEQQWKPVLGLDRYGVPWVVWNDTTRRYNYFSRWLGESFSEKREWRGAFYGLSKTCTLEKHAPAQSPDLGTAVVAAGRLYFCRLPVPRIDLTSDRSYQILDLLDFSGQYNIRTDLTPLERLPENPVFGPNPDPIAWDANVVAVARVFRDQDTYKMIYVGNGPANWKSEKGDITNNYAGYAESKDGIHFQRKNVGMILFNGSRENNLLYDVTAFEDPDQPDPAKRYQGFLSGLGTVNRQLLAQLGKTGHILSVYSADGIHWKVEEDITGRSPVSDHSVGPSYKDPYDIPERRYKSIHRAYNLSGRAIGMSYAAQVTGPWKGFENVLDYASPYREPPYPTKVRSGWLVLEAGGGIGEDQIYGARVWIEDGIYLMGYSACYFDGRYAFSLAMSRDGLNFYRIENGDSSLMVSPAGNWDSGIIAAVAAPIKRDHEEWIYYTGAPWHHNTMLRPGGRQSLTGGIFGRPQGYIGIAHVRSHGWTYASVSDAQYPARLDSLPFTVQSGLKRRLFLNWDTGSAGGQVSVEVLDAATRLPLPGFSANDCHSLQSSPDIPVTWKGGSHLPADSGGPVVLRFHLQGAGVRLYSFRFAG